jgi:hypothetical protein
MTVVGVALHTFAMGAGVFWLAMVIPAAVVAALKRHWLLFVSGFLTLGSVWLVGAASLAEPDSWWARRVYDERKRAQAVERDRVSVPARVTAAAVAAILAALAALLAFAAFPSPILGVDGKSLQYSVGGPSLVGSLKPCHRKADDTWTCLRWDNGSSGAVDYRVTVDSVGCWTARRVEKTSERSPRRLSGCITIRDHLRLANILFD